MKTIRILGCSKQQLPVSEILYLEANINYTLIHTTDGKSYMSARTLKIFEDRLPTFFRANKSKLINQNHIGSVMLPHSIELINGQIIKVSRRKQFQLKFLINTE